MPSFGQLPSITISAKSNLLILHPDTLLTATSISNTTQCIRKPLLSLLLHSLSDVSPALVWGNILHDVMQKCLAARRWDDAYLEDLIDKGLRANLNELVKINMGIDEAKVEVQKRAKGLKSFGKRFIANEPSVRVLSPLNLHLINVLFCSLKQYSLIHEMLRKQRRSLPSQSSTTSKKIYGLPSSASRERSTHLCRRKSSSLMHLRDRSLRHLCHSKSKPDEVPWSTGRRPSSTLS